MPARLLIVDDHEVVRLGERVLFAKDDSLEVCGEAQNGVDAIRMVSETSPDVVILDLSMPGMNGFEIAARIRLVAPSIRIVFFSAHEIPATARWVGADAFVSKSCPLQELALTVNRVLHLRTWEEHHATRTSRHTPPSEVGTDFSSARAFANDSGMPSRRLHNPQCFTRRIVFCNFERSLRPRRVRLCDERFPTRRSNGPSSSRCCRTG